MTRRLNRYYLRVELSKQLFILSQMSFVVKIVFPSARAYKVVSQVSRTSSVARGHLVALVSMLSQSLLLAFESLYAE